MDNTNNTPISSTSLESKIVVENIHKDINSLIEKYAEGRLNVSAYGEKQEDKDGFFLLWIKKDAQAPVEEKVQITTFGQSINMDDVEMAMAKVISDMKHEVAIPRV